MTPHLRHVDLGRMEYASAYRVQRDHVEEVLASREAGLPEVGRILTVEHDPVITVSARPTAAGHLLATPRMLEVAGVAVANTDRGGDITYHGPGQLVVYPILDLNLLNLGLREYMRLLEDSVIEVCRGQGLDARRDATATGAWVGSSKVCAMGVRVKRWISMHGLALNITTNLAHFDLIVPCGLSGRGVTSLQRELGARCPSMEEAIALMVGALSARIEAAMAKALERRGVTSRA